MSARKVAIVGFGPGRENAPFDDPDWECWGQNHLFLEMPTSEYAWDRWFEIHEPYQLKAEREARLAWLSRPQSIPVYCRKEYPEWPSSVALPVGRLSALGARGNYHCSTFDWMLAMALHLGFQQIAIFGLESLEIEAGEPRSARACLEYWCGYAEALGVPVTVEPGTIVLRNWERHGGQYPWDADVSGDERPPANWHAVAEYAEDLQDIADFIPEHAEVAWTHSHIWYRVPMTDVGASR